MSNSITHVLPFPVRNARYTLPIKYVDGSGVPTDPTTPDTEISIDGAAFADCTEEVTTISGSNGAGYITLTATEMDCALAMIAAKAASGPVTSLLELKPIDMPVLFSGTADAGTAGTITLEVTSYPSLVGLVARTTGGTGGGGANNQARLITGHNTSTKVADVSPDWEVTPDNTTTYEILGLEASAGQVEFSRQISSGISSNASLIPAMYTLTQGIDADTDTLISAVTSIQNNTRAIRVVPPQIYIPPSGTRDYVIMLFLYDDNGNMEAPNSAPTLTLTDQADTDLSSRLSSTTMTLVQTGVYKVTYTSTAGDTVNDQLRFVFTVLEGLPVKTTLYPNGAVTVDDIASTFTASDRTTLGDINAKTTNLPANPAAAGDAMDLVSSPDATALTAIATAVLSGDWSSIPAPPSRSLLNAARFLRNKWDITNNVLTVYAENGTTVAWTATVIRDADGAVTGLTPL